MNKLVTSSAGSGDVDVLVQSLIDGVQLDATTFHVGQYCGRWTASTAGRALGGFHLVLHGGCWLHVAGQQPLRLEARDGVFMLRDVPHRLGPDAIPDAVPGSAMAPLGDPAPGATGLACGFFRFHGALASLVVGSLPDYLVLRAGDPALAAVASLFDLVQAEHPPTPDTPSPLIARLAELMFFYVVRHAARRADIASGLLALARLPGFAPLVERMVHAPGEDWSTAAMARTAHMSRSSFYKHFSEASGQAPAQFLLALRTRIAAQRLHGGESVERVAEQVGYGSYAAFSRAFKKVIGEQPGAFRRRAHAAHARNAPEPAGAVRELDERAKNRDARAQPSAGSRLQ
ncbi:AraC family transcriptional regulator [Massilia sp. YIM B02763]|uniref:AraC family transcriptional regulator n=1 Tax=Massilia sp. YIM B02763 TaxID=3050130 RepID=UPI0025B63A9F|nr:AraC family transcriptional regulator [Massilia sp. YIM B02763]MDN4051547.1 AraC family transcriptional regulator [Massilia sp. YIM B02763]